MAANLRLPPNQKKLHIYAKKIGNPTETGLIEPKNLFNTRITIPRGMILEIKDADGVNPNSTDEEEDTSEDDTSEGITLTELTAMTDDEARIKIPSTVTYNIDVFQNNKYRIENRLEARPTGNRIVKVVNKINKVNKGNITRHHPKGF